MRSMGARRVENPRCGGEALVSADVATADCSENLRTRRPPTAACGGTSPTSGEGFTNEPELHEDVIRSQDKEIVEITADSGVRSGLDKVADKLTAGGREEDEIEDPEFDEEDRVGDEATGDDGRVTALDPLSRAKNTRFKDGRTSRGRRAPTADWGEALRARRPPTAACGGTSPTGGEEELLAIETVKRQARAGPMAEAIRDLMASSPEAMEILKEFLPGYRPVSVVSGQSSVAEDLGVHREPLPRAP